MSEQFSDIAHIFFLESIAEAKQTRGVAAARGELMRRAKTVAERTKTQNFDTVEAFVEALDKGMTALTRLEGRATHRGHGIFTLAACPFGSSIKTYMNEFGGMPKEFAEITEDFNKPSTVSSELKVGGGSAVSPFCCIHQPLRSIAGSKLTINNKPIQIFMLGCKSGAGKKSFAEEYLKEAGVEQAAVDKLLDDTSCCYWVKIGA